MSALSSFSKGKPATADAFRATSTAKVVFPTVHLPVLSPGYPLARNTAELEASTSRYFQSGQTPYGKRSRSATETAVAATPPTVLDTVCLEENTQASSGDAPTNTVSTTTTSTPTAAFAARTKAYLTKLFQEPVRCEQDVYRLVDVAHCRRALQEEEAVLKSATGASAKAAPIKVSAFTSCLTIGQHRRYRAVVLDWLRHQPTRLAPQDSGEVLKVVQREQRLFLEVLRREAVARLSSAWPSSYEVLTSALISYAKVRRITQMQERLLCFLDDAKAHEAEILCCCASSTSDQSGDPATTVNEDYRGLVLEHEDEDANASNPRKSTLTPQQLYQRRYPSLRVLQWHMAKLYNSQLTGIAAPFPNPHVQSFLVGVSPAVTGKVHESRGASLIAESPAASPNRSNTQGLPLNAPSSLSLSALPQFKSSNYRDDHSDGEAEHASNSENDKGGKNGGEGVSFSFTARHPPFDSTTSIPVPLLRTYVEHHLLPRFGWLPSRLGSGGDGVNATQTLEHREDVVDSISLSITFDGLRKLFVAHIDVEEPRTSFRVPVRVHLTPLSRNGSGQTSATTSHYHAHVMIGDAVPNVKESRHSVQVAAAEHLLRRERSAGGQDDAHASKTEEKKGNSGSGAGEGAAAASLFTRLELTRSATMQNTMKQDAAAVQAAGGDRIKASAAALLSVKEALADAAPVLPFHVSSPAEAAILDPPESTANGSSRVEFVLAKMEHLNTTSTGTPTTPQTAAVHLLNSETAGRCPYLLELLSPREMLQLDLIFTCYPNAVVHLHRVELRLTNKAEITATVDAMEGIDERGEQDSIQVLVVETLTSASWTQLRQQLLHRPSESLSTFPTPAEVLGTLSWDLLYDTLTWILDSVERRAADAIRNQKASEEAPTTPKNTDRFIYFILSNHANLVNTSVSTKHHAKKPRHVNRVSEDIVSTFTESRFAVRYVLQDVSELYPDYELHVDASYEADNLNFLEESGHYSEKNNNEDGDEKDANPVASRLYRDPHTWNADTIPFTFRRSVPPSAYPSSTSHS